MRIIVDRGGNAGTIAGYLHRVDKRKPGQEQDDPVFHSNMFGRTAEERVEELRFSADLNPRVEKIYIHYKVSFAPGENPDLETKRGITDDILEARNHGQNCQFFAVEHYEKIERNNVHHFHILASSIRLDGSWVDDSFERVRLKQIERDIELKRELTYCPFRGRGDRNSDPIREYKLREKLQAEGKTLIKDDLRGKIDQAAGDRPSLPLLVARLKAEGVEVRFSEFGDGGKGISYLAGDRAFRGRDLGNRYSFDGLHQFAGVGYEPERDDPLLRELNRMSREQCQEIVSPSSDRNEDLSLSSAQIERQIQIQQVEEQQIQQQAEQQKAIDQERRSQDRGFELG